MSPPRPGAPGEGLPAPGDVIAGKYAIVRVLGQGGMGVVYEATHLRLRQQVALKMLLPEVRADEVLATRFDREAHAAARLKGRHVARVMDVDVTPEGLPYMVMELLRGHDLDAELAARGKLPYGEAVDYVLQACAAMVEAHGLGIVHRDLKPSNLFLEQEDDGRIVKVLDFGISKVQSDVDAKLTGAETMMGTAFYMSPEQVRSSRSVDHRADVWGLGVILYELLAGTPPWTGTTAQVAAAIVTEDPPDLRARCVVPSELAAVVETALRREPSARYQDVRSLAVALRPHATPDSIGKRFADSVAASSAMRSPSVAPSEPRVDAGPRVQVGVSSRKPGDVTQPGWTQAAERSGQGRLAMLLVAVTFVLGVVVLGGIAVAAGWLGPRGGVASVGSGSEASSGSGVGGGDAAPVGRGATTTTAPSSAGSVSTSTPGADAGVAVGAGESKTGGGAGASTSSKPPSRPRSPRERTGGSQAPSPAPPPPATPSPSHPSAVPSVPLTL